VPDRELNVTMGNNQKYQKLHWMTTVSLAFLLCR